MWKVVARLTPNRKVFRKLSLLAGALGIAVGAFVWGRQVALSQTTRNTNPAVSIEVKPASANGGDYSNRVVAWIYGNIPVTREDLGEYLIARMGPDRVEALVNRRILDHACRAAGVYVADAEVQDQLNLELRGLGAGITEKEFAGQILKRFNKTLFEWKEDVIRPRLALTKMARPHIQVTNDDLQKAFEARFGPKVKCRMIVMAETDRSHWSKTWEKVRASEEAFLSAARTQYIAGLAAQGGDVPPIHKHFGDARLEKEAFSLKPGEVGSIVEMSDKTAVILKCDAHVPADINARFDTERLALMRDIEAFKLNQKIPEIFQHLKRQAAPTILMGQVRQEDLERSVQRELTSRAPSGEKASPVDISKLPAPPPGSFSSSPVLPSTPATSPTTLPQPPSGSTSRLPSPFSPRAN